MNDGFGLGGLNGFEDVAFDLRLAQNKLPPRIDGRAMAYGEIVVNGDLMAGVEEFLSANGANVSCAAGEKDIHAVNLDAETGPLNGKRIGSSRRGIEAERLKFSGESASLPRRLRVQKNRWVSGSKAR